MSPQGKTRFTTLDLSAAVSELKQLIGARCANVYDINPQTFLLKLSTTKDGAESSVKHTILIESAIRIHTTEYNWPKSSFPSPFAVKLRKHLRTKRLIAVQQLGTDRVAMLQFGENNAANYMFIELYSKGNIILTDKDFMILQLLRARTQSLGSGNNHNTNSPDQHASSSSSNDDENADVKFSVGEPFPFSLTRTSLLTLSKERLHQAAADPNATSASLKKLIVENTDLGPALADHTLLKAKLALNTKVDALNDVSRFNRICDSLAASTELISTINSTTGSSGFILQREEKISKSKQNTSAPSSFMVNIDFSPLLLEQHAAYSHLSFPSFNKAIDEYYSSYEQQKLKTQALRQEKAITDKMNKILKDQDSRMKGLEKEELLNMIYAELIHKNAELVDEIILSLRSLLENSVDWTEIESMLHKAQDLNDFSALHILSLKLIDNAAVILLKDYSESTDIENLNPDAIRSEISQWQKNGYTKITINLGLNAHKNASSYYSKKKQASKKGEKTAQAAESVLKIVEKEVDVKLKKLHQNTDSMLRQRKIYWFEKFLWFISSDKYLVIAGRDAQQNEMLVKRYFKKGDAYVHAEIHGAATCIVKNISSEHPIPPRTLDEAGSLAVCFSSAWEAKIIVSAYWVEHSQVSKTAPSGEYLSVGSFMIRGKRNFLQPTSLMLGLGIAFKLSEDSTQRRIIEHRTLMENTDISAAFDNQGPTSYSANEYGKRALAIQQRARPNNHPDAANAAGSTNHQVPVSRGLIDVNKVAPVTSKKKDRLAKKAGLVQSVSKDSQSSAPASLAVDGQDDLENLGTDLDDRDEDYRILHTIKSKGSGSQQRAIAKQLKQKKKEDKINAKKVQTDIPAKETIPVNLEKYLRPSSLDINQDTQEHSLVPDTQEHSLVPDTQERNLVAVEQDRAMIWEQRREKRHLKKQEVSEVQKLLEEENLLDQEGLDALSFLDELTGKPYDNDELFFAIPVCAPYDALANYTYRVKLTPGSQKKGKAASLARVVILRNVSSPHTKQLIKNIPDTEFMAAMPSKVRIMAPQLQQLIQKSKRKDSS